MEVVAHNESPRPTCIWAIFGWHISHYDTITLATAQFCSNDLQYSEVIFFTVIPVTKIQDHIV